MPFQYKKKDSTRNRSNLNLSVIKNASDDIDKGKSIRGAALEYGIDRNTLRNYLRDRQKLTKINELGSQFKTSQIFSIEEEKKLVNYLLTCSKMNYGLTRKEAQKKKLKWKQQRLKQRKKLSKDKFYSQVTVKVVLKKNSSMMIALMAYMT